MDQTIAADFAPVTDSIVKDGPVSFSGVGTCSEDM